MKKISLIAIFVCSFFVLKAQMYQTALKRTETFITDDNLIHTTDMDLNNGLAQIGYLRPGNNTLVNTPSNSNTATRIHYTHLDNFVPNIVINKLIMPITENPFFLDDNKKYYPTEIKKINEGYIVSGYMEEDPNCVPCNKKNGFLMKIDNNGNPIKYKQYAIADSVKDYIVLNSVEPVLDGAAMHGFVACGYRWQESRLRKRAFVMVVDENLNVLVSRDVNELAVFVPQLNANKFPDSWYNKIVRYNNNELFMVGATGVVSVPEPSLPDGIAYYRGDVLFARCSTDASVRPSTPLFVVPGPLYSYPNDVVELGVSLVQGNSFSNGADYIMLVDHIDDQFSGSTFTSRNATIVITALSGVHSNTIGTWANGGVNGRLDYQNTNYERGTDILLDNNNSLYILCSYDGVQKPIESVLTTWGGGSYVSTTQGDDYIGALGGELVPRDLEADGNGRKILTHYRALPSVEKIFPQGYVSTPGMPNCTGMYHPVVTFQHVINKGNSKPTQTQTISACEIPMTAYEIPITTTDPCAQPKTNPGNGSGRNDKNVTGATTTEIKVYPNPAGNNITLEFSGEIAAASKLEIVTVSGQIVATIDKVDAKANGNSLDMDISNLADGMYFFRVTDSTGSQLQTRFTKVTGK